LYYLIVLLGGTSAVASLYASVLMPWRKLLQANVGWSHLKVILFYGSYAMMREAVSAVSSRISLFFSGSLLGLQQTAILGLSQRFAQVALLPNNAFQSLLFPSLVKSVNDNRPEELREKIESSLAQLLALTLPPALLGVVLSPWLLTWVSGDVYRSGWGLLSVFLIVSTIITPFGAAFGSLVTALHKPSVAFRVVLVNSVINIVLGFVLMKSLGLWGAPLAMLGTEVFGFIWISSIARSMAGVRFASVFTQIPSVYHRLYSKAADRFFIDRKSSSYVNP
jgi:O-antigen/teichoic acid export membrane protein